MKRFLSLILCPLLLCFTSTNVKAAYRNNFIINYALGSPSSENTSQSNCCYVPSSCTQVTIYIHQFITVNGSSSLKVSFGGTNQPTYFITSNGSYNFDIPNNYHNNTIILNFELLTSSTVTSASVQGSVDFR